MVLATALLLLQGCAGDTAIAHGHNTALDSVDLVSMTDDMANRGWKTARQRELSATNCNSNDLAST